MDQNGVLIHRITKKHEMQEIVKHPLLSKNADAHCNGRKVYFRPYMKVFLSFAFKHFDVAFWTSMERRNAESITDSVLNSLDTKFKEKLVFLYSREKCTLQYNKDSILPIALKDLKQIWKFYPQYDKTNTLIVDDSEEKLVLIPENGIVIPSFIVSNPLIDFKKDFVLPRLQAFLYKLKNQNLVDIRNPKMILYKITERVENQKHLIKSDY